MDIILIICCVIGINIGCHLTFSDDKCSVTEIVVAIITFDYKFLNSHCDLRKARLLRNILLVELMIVLSIMKL